MWSNPAVIVRPRAPGARLSLLRQETGLKRAADFERRVRTLQVWVTQADNAILLESDRLLAVAVRLRKGWLTEEQASRERFFLLWHIHAMEAGSTSRGARGARQPMRSPRPSSWAARRGGQRTAAA